MENVYLIGFMGTGKTTIAAKLVDYLRENSPDGKNLELVEMDEAIEKEQGRTIKEIFKEEGEEAFRDYETAFLKKIARKKNLIVSCGGGSVLRKENIEIMKSSGKVVWLDADPLTIYERIKDTKNRPLLENKMTPEYIGVMKAKREPNYKEAAHIRIETDVITIEEIVMLLFPRFRLDKR
ncbi:MAG: shikimate kinase [Lachnospiraceae bacterium]|nr:shikimate kinase [Lachnospiraceae bacterium]